jgi:hypothetical protein
MPQGKPQPPQPKKKPSPEPASKAAPATFYEPDEPLRIVGEDDSARLPLVKPEPAKPAPAPPATRTRPVERSSPLDSPSQVATVGGAPSQSAVARDSGALGPYVLAGELGRGAVGVVYKAFHRDLRQHYAVKVLQDSYASSPESVERFLREARAMARLGKHPHVVQVHAVGTEAGRHYFAMDLVDGETLERRIARGGPLPEREGLELGRKILLALEYAHRQGLVHRDVKPSNVLVDARGEPHVADFGLVKDTSDRAHESRVGVAVGTPAYMAPEQASGGALVDARSDIFSAGATLYHALTGRRPFEGETAHAVMEAVLGAPIVPPRKIVPALSAPAERIILRALERDPARRHATAKAMADDIGRAIGRRVSPDPNATTAEAAAHAGASPRPVPNEYTPIKALRTNELALYAWKLGVFGLVLAPLGVLAGIGALVQLRFGAERERETGRGLAAAGTGIGAAVTAILVAAGIWVAHWSSAGQREAVVKAQLRDAHTCLRAVADAIEAFREKSGAYPPGAGTAALRKKLKDAGAGRGIAALAVDRDGEILDPWGRPLRYRAPGESHRDSYDLYSTGPNGLDERGGGDDLANFDPRFPDLLPIDERDDEIAARKLLGEARARSGGDADRELERLAAEYSSTRAGRAARELVQQRARAADAEAAASSGPTFYDLSSALAPLESDERWGQCIARCKDFLAAKPSAGDRSVVEGKLARYEEQLADAWFGGCEKAFDALATAREMMLAPGAKLDDVERAIREVARPLEALAKAHEPALAGRLAAARAGLAPRFEELRRIGRTGAWRAAVRERVWPFLVRRDLDGAQAEVERLRGEFPGLGADADLEKADVALLRGAFDRALEGGRARAGNDESLKLRGGGWVMGRIAAARDGKLSVKEASGAAREVAVLDLDDETVVRLAAAGASEATPETLSAAGLVFLASGDIARARAAFARAAAAGADVSRYLGKLD